MSKKRTLRNNKSAPEYEWEPTRRRFLRSSATVAAGLLLCPGTARSSFSSKPPLLQFGLMTDPHYAEIDTWNTRYYRESLTKTRECVELMNSRRVDFLIELGDFVNGAPENNLEHLRCVERLFSTFRGERYHVLGNHDLDSLDKEQFQSVVTNSGIPQQATHYSFDRYGIRFIVLDACYREDGTDYNKGNFHWTESLIPEPQMSWLGQKLEETDLPVIVCVHQLLDGDGAENHYINNAADVRRILERHGNVIAVFQGHQHAGQYNRINGIHYVTFKAMVEGSGEENNSYSIVDVERDGSLTITGYRMAENRKLDA